MICQQPHINKMPNSFFNLASGTSSNTGIRAPIDPKGALHGCVKEDGGKARGIGEAC